LYKVINIIYEVIDNNHKIKITYDIWDSLNNCLISPIYFLHITLFYCAKNPKKKNMKYVLLQTKARLKSFLTIKDKWSHSHCSSYAVNTAPFQSNKTTLFPKIQIIKKQILSLFSFCIYTQLHTLPSFLESLSL